MEPNPEMKTEKIPEERANLEICPNCLEPNPDDLAVCSYCGRPLHPADEETENVMTEDEQTLAAARTEAVPAEKKPEKKQQSGFRRIMPWLGLYLIYNAGISCIEIAQQRKLPQEEQPNFGLAYLSAAIWFIAGVLMSWPLIKKGYRKLRHLPDEEEQAETEQQNQNQEQETDEESLDAEQAETNEDMIEAELPEPTEEKAEPEISFEEDEVTEQNSVMTDEIQDETPEASDEGSEGY